MLFRAKRKYMSKTRTDTHLARARSASARARVKERVTARGPEVVLFGVRELAAAAVAAAAYHRRPRPSASRKYLSPECCVCRRHLTIAPVRPGERQNRAYSHRASDPAGRKEGRISERDGRHWRVSLLHPLVPAAVDRMVALCVWGDGGEGKKKERNGGRPHSSKIRSPGARSNELHAA